MHWWNESCFSQCIYVMLGQVELCLIITVYFLQNTHPLACAQGKIWDVFCDIKVWSVFDFFMLVLYVILMVQCKTAVSPLLMQWRYCSLALNHWYNVILNWVLMRPHRINFRYFGYFFLYLLWHLLVVNLCTETRKLCIVWCHYTVMNFCQTPYIRHPIAQLFDLCSIPIDAVLCAISC